MKKHWLVWGLLGTALLACTILVFVDPAETRLLPKCVLHHLTGLHCPGCGATRATHALLHGQWLEAVRFNPMFVFGTPLFLLLLWRRRRREKQGVPVDGRFAYVSFAILLVYFALRNLPSPDSGWLAPPSSSVAAPIDSSID